MAFSHTDMLNALGLGRAIAISYLLDRIRVAAHAPDIDEVDHIASVRDAFNTLNTYPGPLTFQFPLQTLDNFTLRYLGDLPSSKRVYYGLTALLWRSSRPAVEAFVALDVRLKEVEALRRAAGLP